MSSSMQLSRAFLLHALSPVHPGTGQGVGVIDLPIARMKATGIPFLPGSSIKGVMRDAANDQSGANDFLAAFGPEPGEPDAEKHHAGALAFGDARLLLLPVRSLRGTFAWVTSPILLRLAEQDGLVLPERPDPGGEAHCVVGTKSSIEGPAGARKVFLEDLDLTSSGEGHIRARVDALGRVLSEWLFEGRTDPIFTSRLCVVDDETMTFLWETATQVDARNRIGEDGVVAKGQLWWEESLPAETVLVGVVSATGSRRKEVAEDAEYFLTTFVKRRDDLQFGGKSTVGRGRIRFLPLN